MEQSITILFIIEVLPFVDVSRLALFVFALLLYAYEMHYPPFSLLCLTAPHPSSILCVCILLFALSQVTSLDQYNSLTHVANFVTLLATYMEGFAVITEPQVRALSTEYRLRRCCAQLF
jgi:hypothetical protein